MSKKMTDYQSEITQLNKSLAAQKRKLAEAVTKDGTATVKKDEKKMAGLVRRDCRHMGSGNCWLKKGSTQV